MKTSRLFILFLALILCFSCISCADESEDTAKNDEASGERDGNSENGLFAFSYSFLDDNGAVTDKKSEYRRGELIKVHANITNLSDKPYAYHGIGRVDVAASLYCEVDGETYRINGIVHGNDIAPWDCELAPGQTSGRSVWFIVPSDAPLGSYHIRVYYMDFEQVFENVLTITE